MSCTEQPRERSLLGAARPMTMGPIARALGTRRCTSLYPMFPAFRSGKMKVFTWDQEFVSESDVPGVQVGEEEGVHLGSRVCTGLRPQVLKFGLGTRIIFFWARAL